MFLRKVPSLAGLSPELLLLTLGDSDVQAADVTSTTMNLPTVSASCGSPSVHLATRCPLTKRPVPPERLNDRGAHA